MFPILSFAGSMGANLGFNGVAGVQNANQERLALANGVTGNESQEQIAALAQSDKAATLQSSAGGFTADYGYAWEQQAKRMHKKNIQQAQRLQGLSLYA
jgi:hypothetical protein